MKNTLLLVGGVLCLSTMMAQAQDKLTEYKVRPAVTLRMPLPGDSINFTGNKFTVNNLLKTNIDIDFNNRPCNVLSAESDGYVKVDKAQKDNLVYLFSTHLRAERFMKASLKISSPVRFEVFVNGVSKCVKNTTEDSLKNVSAQTVALRMEPEMDYEIVVKLLSSADDKSQPMLKCEFEKDKAFAATPYQAGVDLKKHLTLYNTNYGKRVYKASLSADGKYLLTYYWDNYADKRSYAYQVLTETKTGRVVMPEVNTSMRWMPRSSKLYYTVVGSKGKDLIVFDPVTMREEVVMKNIPEGSFTWSPTEDFLVYSMSDKGEAVQGPIKHYQHPNDRIPGSRSRNYLVKYDPSTGLSERLTYGSHSVYLDDISSDGKRLLCSSSKPDFSKVPFNLNTLFEIDLTTMKADTLIGWQPYGNGGFYSPDGKQILLTGGPEAYGSIGKNCRNHPIANDFDVQAFIMDIATRKIEPITRDFNPSIKEADWNKANGCIYFRTDDEDCVHVYCYNPKTKKFELLQLEEDNISSFSLADQNPSIAAYVGGGYTSNGAAYTYDMKKKASTLIANPKKEELDQITFGKMEDWSFTAADGTLIKGTMCLPPDFDPEKKYPLIVYYYGGTTPTTRGMTSPYTPQLFASRNYVVYVIQPSGAIGYGQEFSARHVNAWGDYTADNIIEGTKKFCEAHPFVNDKKIGCIGASYGGFMTMYLQTKTDMFAAAISHAGISDVTSYWGEGYWGYSYNTVAAAGSYPWSKPELFQRGALFNADKIKTPLLLLQGTKDTNVPIGESIQMYNAMKILGKTVEYVTVDGEDHFIADYAKRVLWHNTIMAWFARWLQDDASWWNDLYPTRNW